MGHAVGDAPRLAAAVAAALCALALTAGWGAAAFNAWHNGALAMLRYRDHDELMATALVRDLPSLCGVGLYGDEAWVRYGGYSHLHRPVPLFWPKDAAALTATAQGFDTLVTDTPPPAALGFATLRCFGEVCVARRPGGCEARPAPGGWWPEQLRGSVPAKPRFEALPPGIHNEAVVKAVKIRTPFDLFLSGGILLRYLVPCVLALGPMFCAGVIFARSFRQYNRSRYGLWLEHCRCRRRRALRCSRCCRASVQLLAISAFGNHESAAAAPCRLTGAGSMRLRVEFDNAGITQDPGGGAERRQRIEQP